MKPPRDAWLIQIEVTTACRHRCAHCTRGVRHVAVARHAPVSQIETALRSLAGWTTGVGCTGGEPTLHPDFPEICEVYRSHFPRSQCGLWSSGGPEYERHRELIERTFSIVNYNDHAVPSMHQPILVACREVVPDEDLRRRLIDNCWIRIHWSPIITVRGAFFCEVAATIDALFHGPGGEPLESSWWEKDESAFLLQRERYCGLCGVPLCLPSLPDTTLEEHVSTQNAEVLRATGSPWAQAGNLKVVHAADVTVHYGGLPRAYAPSDPVYFHVRTPLRAWLWKRAKYRYMPWGRSRFVCAAARFLALKAGDSIRDAHNRAGSLLRRTGSRRGLP